MESVENQRLHVAMNTPDKERILLFYSDGLIAGFVKKKKKRENKSNCKFQRFSRQSSQRAQS